MKTSNSTVIAVAVTVFVAIMLSMTINAERSIEESPEAKASTFDTSVIETNWCGEASDGKVRMVGAWLLEDNDGLMTLEDETGNTWEVADVFIRDDDFLMLWITDCGTSDDTSDDLILKCWAEVH